MAGNENLCIFVGRLAADPETRATSGGNAVVNFRLAINSFWRDRKTGEKRERTEYVSVEVWGSGAQHAQRLLFKGREVYVRARVKTRKWQDPEDGKDRFFTSFVCENFQVFGPKPVSTEPGAEEGETETVAESVEDMTLDGVAGGEPEDDDIPF